jgi:chromosome transmission fidelity protein 18
MLKWIKSWDYVVFNKEFHKEKASSVKTIQKDDVSNSGKKRKRMYNQNEIELEEKLLELDDHNRPKFKVALISGPPGLGKEIAYIYMHILFG